MKKLLTLLLVTLFMVQLNASALDWTTAQGLTQVTAIGTSLLTKNKLPNQVKFVVDETDDVNAFANVDGEIHVYTGLLKFVSDTNELAAVISHEMGHIVNHHVTKQNTVNTISSTAIANLGLSGGVQTVANAANSMAMLKMSRTEEYEADISGVDLMVNAGYNPLGMVSLLNSLDAGGNTTDILSTHPSGDKRTMNAYNYICYTYPDKAGVNVQAAYNTASFQSFLAYAKPIVDARNADPKKLAKFNKEQAKLKTKRAKKMAKYQKSGTSAWDSAFNTIQMINSLQQQQ